MSNSNEKRVNYQHGKTKREHIRLPELYFVAADNWIDTLGKNAFCAWLKFYSWGDRRDQDREYDKIPWSLKKTAEKLGIKSMATLYNTIIKPLWNYGFIDLEEWKESGRKSQKPINIIVYKYPANDPTRAFRPLEKLRDYDKDYQSNAQIFGKQGGRPKKEEETGSQDSEGEAPFKKLNGRKYRLKNKTVYRLKNKTVTVQKIKPNNLLNNLSNQSNKPSNELNNHHQKPVDDDDAGATNSQPWEKDEQYKKYNQLYIDAGADPIFDHEKHYEKYKKAVERVGYDTLCEATRKYIEEQGASAQIVYFLSGTYNKYLPKKQADKKQEQPMPYVLLDDYAKQYPGLFYSEEVSQDESDIANDLGAEKVDLRRKLLYISGEIQRGKNFDLISSDQVDELLAEKQQLVSCLDNAHSKEEINKLRQEIEEFANKVESLVSIASQTV